MSAANTVIKSFIKKGFRLAGCGVFSAVFESQQDPNIVYKVGTNSDNYLSYISANFSSEHFPKVHRVFHGEGYYIATLEKLDRVSSHKLTPVSALCRKILREEDIGSDSFAALVDQIRLLVESIEGTKLDIHSSNVMMRGMTLVITDPIASEYTIDAEVHEWIEDVAYKFRQTA